MKRSFLGLMLLSVAFALACDNKNTSSNNTGNANIHYDRRLQHDFWVVGHPIMGTFNWKRF